MQVEKNLWPVGSRTKSSLNILGTSKILAIGLMLDKDDKSSIIRQKRQKYLNISIQYLKENRIVYSYLSDNEIHSVQSVNKEYVKQEQFLTF